MYQSVLLDGKYSGDTMKKIQLTTIIRMMLVFLFAVCVVPQSKAADLKTGLSAYEKGEWKTALKEFQPLADQGEVEAQSKLAVMYREGRGVTQDFNMVVKWYTKATEQGDMLKNNPGDEELRVLYACSVWNTH
jgi:hypothetical protein